MDLKNTIVHRELEINDDGSLSFFIVGKCKAKEFRE